jgi:hypothetical protein
MVQGFMVYFVFDQLPLIQSVDFHFQPAFGVQLSRGLQVELGDARFMLNMEVVGQSAQN